MTSRSVGIKSVVGAGGDKPGWVSGGGGNISEYGGGIWSSRVGTDG